MKKAFLLLMVAALMVGFGSAVLASPVANLTSFTVSLGGTANIDGYYDMINAKVTVSNTGNSATPWYKITVASNSISGNPAEFIGTNLAPGQSKSVELSGFWIKHVPTATYSFTATVQFYDQIENKWWPAKTQTISRTDKSLHPLTFTPITIPRVVFDGLR